MAEHGNDIPEDRELHETERKIVRWALEHGDAKAQSYLKQVPALRIVSRCSCGCPSVNFAYESEGFCTLADYEFDDPGGGLAGLFVFAVDGKLAGLDVWSIDGIAKADRIPDCSLLRPLGGK